MRHKAPVAALFAVWLVAGSVAFAQQSGLQAQPKDIGFGPVCVGKSSQKTFKLRNTHNGEGQVLNGDITRVSGPGFSQPTPSSFHLDPEGEETVTIGFTAQLPPGGRVATYRADPDEENESSVDITASASVIHRLIAVDTSTVAFGEQRVGTRSPSKQLTIRNPGQDAIQISSLKRIGANRGDFIVTAPAVPFTIPKGDFRTVTIAFQPTGEGLRRGTLEITSNSCTQPKLNVTLVGTGVFPNVVVEPNPVDVGSSPVGKAGKPAAITVSNEGAAELKITAVQIIGADAADFVLTGLPPVPKTLQPSESFVFNIRMKATAEGLRLATINVLSDDPDGGTFAVAVRGTATPAVSPSPSASATATASPTPTATASASEEPGPAGTPNDSLAIILVVGGVLGAFVGLMMVRRFVRTPDDEDL